MAPRKPKPDDDTASTTSTDAVLKPNTSKAKVEKPKTEKAKTVKAKAVKKEKVVGDGEEKPVKKTVKKVSAGEELGKSAGKDAGKGDKDGKEKVKPVTGEEAVQLILSYLKAQNRPYSATEISANLHGKVTKTNADKLLKEMEQNGQIMGKATKKDGGGQWVFWPIQDPLDAASPEELATMDTHINTLRETNPNLKSTLKTLTNKLANLKSAPTTSELSSIVCEMQASLKEKRERLEGYKSGTVKIITKEELERTEKEWKYWSQKRMVRKRAFVDLEGDLLDGIEGLSKEDLWDKARLEEDVM